MPRCFTLRLRSGEAIIELLDQEAPVTCQQFWSALPIESFLSHAKFAGDEVFFGVPYVWEPENLRTTVTAGDVAYYPGRQTVCIFYGQITPFGQVSTFGHVVSGLDALRKVAQGIRTGGAVNVTAAPCA